MRARVSRDLRKKVCPQSLAISDRQRAVPLTPRAFAARWPRRREALLTNSDVRTEPAAAERDGGRQQAAGERGGRRVRWMPDASPCQRPCSKAVGQPKDSPRFCELCRCSLQVQPRPATFRRVRARTSRTSQASCPAFGRPATITPHPHRYNSNAGTTPTPFILVTYYSTSTCTLYIHFVRVMRKAASAKRGSAAARRPGPYNIFTTKMQNQYPYFSTRSSYYTGE